MASWRLDYMTLVGHLLVGRERRGLTQISVARRLGISRRTFQRYEAGDIAPDALTLFHWASVVGVRLASEMTPGQG